MKILNNITPGKIAKTPLREILQYKYLRQTDHSVEAIVTVDKKTGEFLSYDKFTRENPYPGDKPVKKILPQNKHKKGEVFTTTYLKSDKITPDMSVKYRWISDDEYEVIDVKRF